MSHAIGLGTIGWLLQMSYLPKERFLNKLLSLGHHFLRLHHLRYSFPSRFLEVHVWGRMELMQGRIYA